MISSQFPGHAARTAMHVNPATRTRVSTSGRLFMAVMLIVIYEGAIRKWVADSSTLPLILLRDGLAAYAVLRAFWLGHFRRERLATQVAVMWSFCVIGWGLLQLMLGESTFPIYLIGLRFWLLYLWFAIAAVAGMNERDYIVSLRVLLYSLVLMAPLAVIQQQSPLDSPFNKTLDDDPSNVFTVVAGVARATATFSFTAGFTTFLALCAPFALGVLEARKRKPSHQLMALVIFGSLIICVLVSGARSAFVFIGGLLCIYLAGNLIFSPVKRKGWAIFAAVLTICVVLALGFVFQDALMDTQERFKVASEHEDFMGRVLTILLGEGGTVDRVTWLGAGIGIGSNLAQYVRSGSTAYFVFGETEAGRTLIEAGLLGGVFVLLKLGVAVTGLLASLRRARQTRAIYPVVVWITLVLAMQTWQTTGQLSANGLFALMFALGMLSLRYPVVRLFN
ncbi:hypothetical protein QTH91_03530 [Variovorax dokdonensis]|uniref:O-antigen ligase domain-containing protein n=1 Tax=Variovorax dokdonensis TaxID=344883 RepID=A0ABT7N6I5_9BURK|nr:hypothetical protein [Variovorax dokdonensis]MDM0043542.1 hypothetical protein [Variovorax dokdonensis]